MPALKNLMSSKEINFLLFEIKASSKFSFQCDESKGRDREEIKNSSDFSRATREWGRSATIRPHGLLIQRRNRYKSYLHV